MRSATRISSVGSLPRIGASFASHAAPSIGRSTDSLSSPEYTITLASSTEPNPSTPGAISASPSRMAFTKFVINVACAASAPGMPGASAGESGIDERCDSKEAAEVTLAALRRKDARGALLCALSTLEVLAQPIDATKVRLGCLEAESRLDAHDRVLDVDRVIERAQSGRMAKVDDVRGVSCADFREIKRVDDLAVGKMDKEVKALQKLARVRAAEGDYEGSRSAVSE